MHRLNVVVGRTADQCRRTGAHQLVAVMVLVVLVVVVAATVGLAVVVVLVVVVLQVRRRIVRSGIRFLWCVYVSTCVVVRVMVIAIRIRCVFQ